MNAPASPRLAVLVSGASETVVRRFLAGYVKPAFGLRKNQWRVRYREEYALAVLSRPLRLGETAESFYGAHATAAVLVLACLAEGVRDSGRDAARAWLKQKGYDPLVELVLGQLSSESEAIDLGAEVVNFINHNCPWRVEPIDDIEAYLAANNKPFWA